MIIGRVVAPSVVQYLNLHTRAWLEENNAVDVGVDSDLFHNMACEIIEAMLEDSNIEDVEAENDLLTISDIILMAASDEIKIITVIGDYIIYEVTNAKI